MKQLGFKLALGGLATGLLLFTAQPSFATVSGTLLTGGTGTLTVSQTALTFTPNDLTGFSSEVAAGTDLTFSGCSGGLGSPGCLKQGEGVDFNGGNTISGLGPISDFITFQNNPNLLFNLSGYAPGSTNTSCATLAVGQSCSVFAGSPVVLTLESNNNTAAQLGVMGTATDGSAGPASNWNGAFTATVTGQTPGELQSLILAHQAITHTYSGQFVVSSVSPVPEPRLISLMLMLGLGLVVVAQRRKREA